MATVNKNGTVTMTQQELDALMAKSRNEGAAAATTRKVSWKVGDKGNLVISLGSRWPFTFYISQWDAIMSHLDEIKKFVEANRSKFTTKTAE